jgi:FtsZ-binding cell division protein ZapB
MVKINVTDFVDLLAHQDVKSKLGELFDESILKIMIKSQDLLNKKVDELTATINMLRMELQNKDLSINQLKTENASLKKEISTAMGQNDNLQQELKRENLIFSGFRPTFAEAVGDAENPHRISSNATKQNFVKFCNEVLDLPTISADDISTAYFLPTNPTRGAANQTRLLSVRFVRRSTRDEIYTRRFRLKDFNSTHDDKVFVNEDLTQNRRKISAALRAKLKSKTILGCWTSAGVNRVKLLNGSIITVHSLDDLRNV